MASPVSDAPFVFSAGMAMPGGGVDAARSGSPRGNELAATDDLIRQTRREISEIVREVAELARRPTPIHSFFSALLDRTTRALAAEGAVLWDMTGEAPKPVLRTGRVTDQQIHARGRTAHDALLAEIAASGSPVVVPPTPIDSASGDWVSDQPANPTDRPAAVVPILDPLAGESKASRYLLEVFLEPDAGVATQRGYLRFTAQMADLAGDFLRLDELRRGRVQAASQKRLSSVWPRLHRHDRLETCAAEIVDIAAELLAAARVTLVQLRPLAVSPDSIDIPKRLRRSRILAISHVESIDHRGAACRSLLEQIVSLQLAPGQTVVLSEPQNMVPEVAQNAILDDASLASRLAISLGQDDRYRLLVQTKQSTQLADHDLELIESFANHAVEALRSIERIAAVPMARTWLSIFGSTAATCTHYGTWVQRMIVAGAAGGTILMAGMIPKTMTVSLSANLRPANVRTHYSPSDAVVQQVLVRHGDAVVEGQTMIVLQDLALDEQTTTLIGRRAVISEKLARVVGSLVELPSSGVRSGNRENAHTSDEALVQQQRLLEEEQRGIDQQLDLLAQARQRLVIRADRDGTVDAWQTELVALGRPVRTGETLVRVQPADARWVVDAKVPQNRRLLVMQRLSSAEEPVRLRIGDSEGEAATATFTRQIGFETPPTGGPPATIVELAIDAAAGEPNPSSTTQVARWRNGMPVEVTVDCGKMPLVKVLFFDLIRSVRLQWEKWL
ncbi:MAG TPA: hypothetical protein DDZ51_13060 [Planctomycetaceae bacterium]|nr:hypothetical protein [Planctomycetaceae bacterium]